MVEKVLLLLAVTVFFTFVSIILGLFDLMILESTLVIALGGKSTFSVSETVQLATLFENFLKLETVIDFC